MNGLAWVSVAVSLLPIPFMIWFGFHPLWVDRRLRRAGVETTAECRGYSVSEDRYSTSFEFLDAEGFRTVYISPLLGGPVAASGEKVAIVYDPRKPERARTRRELRRRSPAWFSLGVLGAIELFFLCSMAAVFLYFDVW